MFSEVIVALIHQSAGLSHSKIQLFALALGLDYHAINCNLLLASRMVTQDLTQNDHNYNKNSGSILVTFLELSKNKQKLNNLLLNGNHIPYAIYVYLFRTILATHR